MDRLVAEPTTIDLCLRAFAAAKQRHVAALDGAIEKIIAFIISPSTYLTTSAAAEVSTAFAAGNGRAPHDVCGRGNHETSIALVRGRVAGVDRAGSVGGAYKLNRSSSSTGEAKETTFGARDAEDDSTEIKIAVKAAIVLVSPAKTMVGNAICWLWKQRKENVRIAETAIKRASHVASVLKAEEAACTWIPVHGRSNRNSSSTCSDAGRGATATVGTGSGVDEPPTREEDDVARKGGDHRSAGGHHDGGGMRLGRLLWQERQDPVQGLRSGPENRGRQAEVQADETSKTAGDTGDDGVAFTGGAVAPSPSKVVRGNRSVGKGVGHYVRVFVAAVVLGCAVLLCCTALFRKHAGTHAGTHVGTVKECISIMMVASPHAVRSLKSVKKGGESSGKSGPHLCSGEPAVVQRFLSNPDAYHGEKCTSNDMNNQAGVVMPQNTAVIKTTLLLQEATNYMPYSIAYSDDIEGGVVPQETTMNANGPRIAFTEPLDDDSDQTPGKMYFGANMRKSLKVLDEEFRAQVRHSGHDFYIKGAKTRVTCSGPGKYAYTPPVAAQGEEVDKEEKENRRGVGAIQRHNYLHFGATVLSIVAAFVSSVLHAGGVSCAYSARARSSHRRCLFHVRSAMVGLALMPWVNAGCTYPKTSSTYCSSSSGSYLTLPSAQDACSASSSCTGVYDQSCDGGTWTLCTKYPQVTSSYLTSSSGSCVYKKTACSCTASTCCEVAIPLLPLTTTRIDSSVCNQGTYSAS
jgi:hypothetical protein